MSFINMLENESNRTSYYGFLNKCKIKSFFCVVGLDPSVPSELFSSYFA
jgi:hypothetical protein